MTKLLVALLVLAPLGCHSDHATDPNCARIETACASGTTPAQESCHELAHSDNAAQCAARVAECVATCGGGGADAGAATDAPASGG
jgi:hypothetical protein